MWVSHWETEGQPSLHFAALHEPSNRCAATSRGQALSEATRLVADGDAGRWWILSSRAGAKLVLCIVTHR